MKSPFTTIISQWATITIISNNFIFSTSPWFHTVHCLFLLFAAARLTLFASLVQLAARTQCQTATAKLFCALNFSSTSASYNH